LTFGLNFQSTITNHHSHIKVTLADDEKTFKSFHKMLGDKHEIIELQHMLKRAGLAPESVN